MSKHAAGGECMPARTRADRVLRVDAAQGTWRRDRLAVEEPLELRLGGRPLTVTMRTPGNDFDLAVGFLLGEGIIRGAHDIHAIRACAGKQTELDNVLDVELTAGAPGYDARAERSFAISSACGLCGRASIDSLRARLAFDVAGDPLRVGSSVLAGLPETLRA